MKIEICSVDEHGLAAKAGICAADKLISVNGREIADYIEYCCLAADGKTVLEIEKPDGSKTKHVLDTSRGYIGIEFGSPVFDGVKVCANKCVFCFMDQSPQGMRKSLYLKDDDYRLSFLQGNYITLTNLTENDWERIEQDKLSPLYVSVHTLNADQRIKLLKNPKAGLIREHLQRLCASGISFYVQLVLCKGINDGAQLESTLKGLLEVKDALLGIGVVPAGITNYREQLEDIMPFDSEAARETIALIKKWQKIYLKECGARLIYAADEFFCLSEQALPSSVYYEGYEMLEDGIGMLRKLTDQFKRNAKGKNFSSAFPKDIVTSVSAYPYLLKLLHTYVYPWNDKINLVPAKNLFYGGNVDVSGLLTAADIYQIAESLKTNTVLLPENMFNQDDLTLDGATVEDISSKIRKHVRVVRNNGLDLVKELLA